MNSTQIISDFALRHSNCVLDKIKVNTDTFRFTCQVTNEGITVRMPYVTCDGQLRCALAGYCKREHACND